MAIAVDASSQTAWAQSAVSGGTITSAAFSPVAGSLLLVAFADENSAASNADSAATITNTGTALTWTRVAVSNRTSSGSTWNGASAFFWALNTAAQTGITVTVTPSGATTFDRAVIVKVITGHDPVSPVGTSGVGNSTVSGNLAVTYTATGVASLGFLTFYQGFSTITLTAGTGTTIDAQLHTTSNNDALLARQTTPSAGLTSQTLNVGTSGATQITYAYLEVLPAASQAEGSFNSSAMALMRG